MGAGLTEEGALLAVGDVSLAETAAYLAAVDAYYEVYDRAGVWSS